MVENGGLNEIILFFVCLFSVFLRCRCVNYYVDKIIIKTTYDICDISICIDIASLNKKSSKDIVDTISGETDRLLKLIDLFSGIWSGTLRLSIILNVPFINHNYVKLLKDLKITYAKFSSF